MLAAGISKPLIFVVISVLVIALLYGPLSAFEVNALPPDPKYESGTCGGITTDKKTGEHNRTCCWTQTKEGSTGVFKPRAKYCQTCSADAEGKFTICDKKRIAEVVANEPPTPPPTEPSGPFVLPEEGILQEPTPPSSDPAAPLQDGVLQQPPADQGAAIPTQPATEGSQPATVDEEQPVPVCQEGLEFNEDLGFCIPTDCPEGQELNEDTGICVLEEQPAADEEQEEQQQTEEEQPQPEGEQPSEESGSEGDNSNN